MKTIDEIIQNRQSHFTPSFNGSIAEGSLLERLFKNAHHAPSHKRTYPWRFVVFDRNGLEELMNKLSEIYLNITPREKVLLKKLDKMEANKTKVSHVIAIIVQYHPETHLPAYEEEAAVACAVQNMYLTLAEEKEFGGYWSSGKLIATSEFAEFLQLDKHQSCLGLFYIGGLSNKKPAVPREGYEHHVRRFQPQ